MALTKFGKATNNISLLADRPNQQDGLTPAQLKAKFDQAGADLKEYINNTLTAEVDNVVASVIDAKADKAYIDQVANDFTLGTVPNNSLTEAKMAAEMKKDIVGGVASYDGVTSQLADLTYQELSSYASNIDDNGLYKTVTWKRKDNTTYAVSSLIGTAPYTQVKIDYYDDIGITIIKTITWDLTYDENEFIYEKVVV